VSDEVGELGAQLGVAIALRTIDHKHLERHPLLFGQGLQAIAELRQGVVDAADGNGDVEWCFQVPPPCHSGGFEATSYFTGCPRMPNFLMDRAYE